MMEVQQGFLIRLTFSSILCLSTGHASKLMLILMDGFKWNYFDLPDVSLPGFRQMFREGVRAEYMQSDFPSVSYPNYYSIMTGLHCESHGMVGNYMYDVSTGKEFLIGGNLDQNLSLWWDDGEPLWVTAEKQNKRAYFYDWPGCEVTIRGTDPTYCKAYTKPTMPADLETSITEGLLLFKNDSADVVGIYLEAPDKYGHRYGAASEKLKGILRETDSKLQKMINLLETMDLKDQVNVMIFSDHGMANFTKIANLTNVIDPNDWTEMLSEGTFVNIWPKEGRRDKIINDIEAANISNIQVFKKEELPSYWFLKRHQRTPPLLVVGNLGTAILTSVKPNVYTYPDGKTMTASHGYDNRAESMRAIFVAMGPAFKKKVVTRGFMNVELYQVMCHILNIKPAPHNGTWANVKDMLNLDASTAERTHAELSLLIMSLFALLFYLNI